MPLEITVKIDNDKTWITCIVESVSLDGEDRALIEQAGFPIDLLPSALGHAVNAIATAAMRPPAVWYAQAGEKPP